MLFNTPEYAVFLALVLLIYYRMGLRSQNIFLLLASYVFYGAWDYRFLALLWISTLVDYAASHWIERSRERGDRRGMRAAMGLSLTANLGILGFFKYFNFFTASAEALLGRVGLTASWPLLHIVLPVGISFYTFQTLSYTIDVYRGTLKPVRRLDDFALYVAFFPQLVAGPIERATNLLPQIEQPRVVDQERWRRGLYLILIGLVRKMVIADTAAVFADRTFAHPGLMTSPQLAAGLFFYALQIYGDFSGYSNIARGSAQLLGFDLMRNFRHPYFARNVSDFWRRWHISLSTWLRDYLYIPLGGNRKGRRRTYINLMLTMLLGGLWHGASWNFVLWGGLHGLYLAGYQALRRRIPFWNRTEPARTSRIGTAAGIAVTLLLVVFTWLFFRSHDMATTSAYLTGLASLSGWLHPPLDAWRGFLALGLLTGLTLAIDLPQAITDDEYCFLHMGEWRRAALAGTAVLLIALSGSAAVPFIYFQF